MNYLPFDARHVSLTIKPLPARILCIQAERSAATTLARRLAAHGYVTALAHDGPQGLSAILKSRPDAVVCDLHLPSLGGRELRDRLLALTPLFSAIPFIFVGNDARGAATRGTTRPLDGDGYVADAGDVQTLERSIERCLARVEHDARLGRHAQRPQQIELSDREAECLAWSALGRTPNDIAGSNGPVRRGVEFAIETACRKLKLGLGAHGRVGVV